MKFERIIYMYCVILTFITQQISISCITAIFAVSIVFFTQRIVQTVTTTVVHAVKTVCSVNTLCNRNILFKMMFLKLYSPRAEVGLKIQNKQCQSTERNLLSNCRMVNSGRTQHAKLSKFKVNGERRDSEMNDQFRITRKILTDGI